LRYLNDLLALQVQYRDLAKGLIIFLQQGCAKRLFLISDGMETHRDGPIVQAPDFLIHKRFDPSSYKRGDLGLQLEGSFSYLLPTVEITGQNKAKDKRSEQRKIPDKEASTDSSCVERNLSYFLPDGHRRGSI
jgi:hypothetical protein